MSQSKYGFAKVCSQRTLVSLQNLRVGHWWTDNWEKSALGCRPHQPEEQFQAVGLLCREVLISLAQTVFDPELHPPLDGVGASETDAKRMLDRYLAIEVIGSSNALARKQAKGALQLANELQHRRTASFREAALCAEATASLTNLIAIISGVRDP